ncbi:hypothetical protein IQ266_02660 [filamentous cyanobacterium LEGE 11480]|uniref:Uncharacterized protein n=1 Tax=Romeriopsis navalis LEGE 11480 TaxID=2777977 RepID=A0A928VMM8_9CYAN|nr:hypothetical protein [Romeriopsis navalis]MBE9028659.1 hypothetical protein [Romeriopsis navalis LEGE 11480]
MTTTLKSHPIWHNVTQTVEAIDPTAIATQHLQACNAQINGYWDEEDQFYEIIRFSQSPQLEVISSALGVTPNHNGGTPWLNFKYALKIPGSEATIGELSLILNDSLKVIDENWLIDIHSPHVLSQ